MDVKELEEKIQYYAQKYYEGEPEVSDDVFDTLVAELVRLNPTNRLLKTIAWGYSPSPGKFTVRHRIYPISGLQKIKYNEFESYKGLDLDSIVVVTPKLDGGSVVCYYVDGVLERVVTRGDGFNGIDITKNIVHTIPSTIPINGITVIRGEVIVTLENCEKVESIKHPRNVSIGLSQRKEQCEETKLLRVIAYSILNDVSLKVDQLKKLESWGFTIPKYKVLTFNSFREMIFQEDPLFFDKNSLFYKVDDGTIPYDGLVISENNYQTEYLPNSLIKVTHKSIAYKFKEEFAITEVNYIQWNVSNMGKLVPLLIINPVELDGSTISKIAGNNISWLKEKRCGIHSVIKVIRANEVVPSILSVDVESDFYNEPTHCPKCNTELVMDGKHLVCPNNNCPGKQLGSIKLLFDKFKVKGLGPSAFNDFIKIAGDDMTTIFETIQQNIDQLNLKKKKDKLMYQTLQNILEYKYQFSDIVLFLNIPGVGIEKLKEINSEDDFNKFLENYPVYIETANSLKKTFLFR
jgi:DNA ligase (NAD+)